MTVNIPVDAPEEEQCGKAVHLDAHISNRGGDSVGAHLSLLSIFFPGYSVSWSGALAGLFWGFAGGGLSGMVLYWSYSRMLRERLDAHLLDTDAPASLTPPVLLFSGNALGTALGALMALQLLLTTNWLVVRGTAAYSTNAALLGQYLPGYTVSPMGSIVGATELFAATFVMSHVFAGIHNAVAKLRQPREVTR